MAEKISREELEAILSRVDVLTVREALAFYSLCKENYKHTQGFIQDGKCSKGGSYITYAKCVGHSIDYSKGEPNQRFHFLESWALRSLLDGTICLDESFYAVIANGRYGIKCKELILWLLEAAECAPAIEEFESVCAENKYKINIKLFVSEERLTKSIKECMKKLWDGYDSEQFTIAANVFKIREKRICHNFCAHR